MKYEPEKKNIFDKLIHLNIIFFNKKFKAYQFFGYMGLISGTTLGYALTYYTGLSFVIFTALVISAAITFFSLAMITKILSGEEHYVFYHYKITVLAMSGLVLWVFKQPILVYLDIMVLGIGTFLMFGRIGCLMVGCCHGRPNSWGVRYGIHHVADGFPSCMANIRLFPVQLVESFIVYMIVLSGIVMLSPGSKSGLVFSWYLFAYGMGRFFIEFLRGDAERPFRLGLSEAQWTSMLLITTVITLKFIGILPRQLWHFYFAAILAVAAFSVVFFHTFISLDRFKLLHPTHVREIVEIINHPDYPATENNNNNNNENKQSTPQVKQTSQGLLISRGKIYQQDRLITHYAFSKNSGFLARKNANSVMRLVGELRHSNKSFEVIEGQNGIFHMLIFS